MRRPCARLWVSEVFCVIFAAAGAAAAEEQAEEEAACGSGRRRRNPLGGDSACGCAWWNDRGVCVAYNDNCCEPFANGCCADGCVATDPACTPPTTTITRFKSTVTSTTPTTTTTTTTCGWLFSTDGIGEFECGDGSSCSNSTSCCRDLGGRAKCPANRQVMCNLRTCGGYDDYCCATKCTAADGGPRLCLEGQFALAAASHSLFVAEDHTAYALGHNWYGQLGPGAKEAVLLPSRLLDDVLSLAAGGAHTVILRRDNSVWTLGSNSYGQLGDGTLAAKARPTLLRASAIGGHVRSVAAGGLHTIFLRSDGVVLVAGWNAYGQLGDNSTEHQATPTRVRLDSEVVAATAGSSHTVLTTIDGTAWAMGLNGNGQLGDGTLTNRLVPVRIFGNVESIAAGVHHTLFLRKDGSIWATGHNNYGQLGDGSDTDRLRPVRVLDGASAVAAGMRHSLFLRRSGEAWATGDNDRGQLGVGTKDGRKRPGLVMKWVYAISAGDYHSFFLRLDGSVWATGHNHYAQLGRSSISLDVLRPVRVLHGLFPPGTTTTTTSYNLTAGTTASLSIVPGRQPTRAPSPRKKTSASDETTEDAPSGEDEREAPGGSVLAYVGAIIAVVVVWVLAIAMCCFYARQRSRRHAAVAPQVWQAPDISTTAEAAGLECQEDDEPRDPWQGGLSWRVRQFAPEESLAEGLGAPIDFEAAFGPPPPPKAEEAASGQAAASVPVEVVS